MRLSQKPAKFKSDACAPRSGPRFHPMGMAMARPPVGFSGHPMFGLYLLQAQEAVQLRFYPIRQPATPVLKILTMEAGHKQQRATDGTGVGGKPGQLLQQCLQLRLSHRLPQRPMLQALQQCQTVRGLTAGRSVVLLQPLLQGVRAGVFRCTVA